MSAATNSLAYLGKLTNGHVPGLENLGQLIAFNINGVSMQQTIKHGDTVFTKMIDIEDVEDMTVHVIITNKIEVYCKRVQRLYSDNGTLTSIKLLSDNSEAYQPFVIEISKIKQLFKVVRLMQCINL